MGGAAVDPKLFGAIDSQTLAIVVPAGAVTGVITVTTPHGTANSATQTISGAVQAIAVTVGGHQLLDQNSAALVLRGVNNSGLETYSAQGFLNPWLTDGGAVGFEGNYAKMRHWKVNAIRFPLNEGSWLGYPTYDSYGVFKNPDPSSNYRQTVIATVNRATAAGLYVILDLHWSAPGNYLPIGQPQMADTDHSLNFWNEIANTFKSYPNVIFELFNEPYLIGSGVTDTSDQWSIWRNGGTVSYYVRQNQQFNHGVTQFVPWNAAGMQTMLSAVRAAGATNVVLCGGLAFSEDLTGTLMNLPVDPLNQLCVAWHPYRPSYLSAAGAWWVWWAVAGIVAAQVPLVCTETGDSNDTGLIGSAFYEKFYPYLDSIGASYFGWTWDSWGQTSNDLIRAAYGNTTDGWGRYYLQYVYNA